MSEIVKEQKQIAKYNHNKSEPVDIDYFTDYGCNTTPRHTL